MAKADRVQSEILPHVLAQCMYLSAVVQPLEMWRFTHKYDKLE